MAEEKTVAAESGPLSVGDAAQKLEGLMSPPEGVPPPEPSDAQATESEEAPVDTAEEPADDDDASDDEGEAEAADDDDTDDDEDASDEDPDDEEPEPELYTVKIDGKESKVSRAELIAGYQLSKAAQSRMNEAAEMRKAAEATHQQVLAERQRVAQERDNYLSRLQEIERQYSNVQEPDWSALAAKVHSGEMSYEDVMQQQLAWRQVEADQRRIAEERRAVQAQRDQEAKAAQQQAEQQHREFLRAEQERLLERLPAWKDPEKAQADKAEMRTLAKQYYGIPDEELNAITRHDHVLVLRDAIQWRKHKAKAKAVSSKVKAAPPKVAEPKAAPVQKPRAERERSAAMNRLRQTKSVSDAAQALLHMG